MLAPKAYITIVMLLLGTQVVAQQYAAQEYYLIDSLDLNTISKKDQLLVDSALNIYHKCTTDTCRARAISLIVEGSWDEKLWPRYNAWVHNYVIDRLRHEENSVIAKELKKFHAGALNNIGYLHNSKSESDLALEYYNKSLEIQKEVEDDAGMSGTLINIGYIYLNQGLIERALEHYYESLRIEEKLQNKPGIATALNSIGYIQYRQGDAKRALQSYNKSLEIRTQLDDQYGMATCLNNIGLIFKDQRQWVKALEYYQKCMKLQEKVSDQSGIAISLGNIGLIYASIGGYDNALKYYSKSLEIRKNLQDKMGVALMLNSIASTLLQKKGDLNRAAAYARRSLEMAQDLNYPVRVRDAAETLFRIAKARKEWSNALRFHELYIQMRDSVFNEETITAAIHQEYKYNYEKKALADSIQNADRQQILDAELAASESERERLEILAANQRLQSYLLIFGIVSAFVLVVLIYTRMKAIDKHKKTIEQQKEDLEHLNQDLKEFAHIISHDLKTPLHVIISMVYLMEEDYPDLGEDFAERLKLIKDSSIKSNELIEGVLAYSEAGRKDVDFKSIDINDLLSAVIKQIDNKKGVRINVATPMPVIQCNEFQFQQILANLIGNAVKYNDKVQSHGEVVISYTATNKHHEFTITDNGPGIPKYLQEEVFEIFQKAPHSEAHNSSGIGLSIVKKLVTQNGGTVNLESEEGHGASFRFTWPK